MCFSVTFNSIVSYSQFIQLSLHEDSFRIEDDRSCEYDYLSLTTDRSTTKYCGSDSPAMTVYEDYLVIIFHSDGSVQDSGFLINYVVLGNGHC